VQPGPLVERKHKGVKRRKEEVESKRPKGKIGKEAERLANSSLALWNLVGRYVHIL
jgi:hypothetical protein